MSDRFIEQKQSVADCMNRLYARGLTTTSGGNISLRVEGGLVLMQNHGVLTVGDNLLQAFDRIEVLENTAKINVFALLLGGSNKLNLRQCRELDAQMGRPTSRYD